MKAPQSARAIGLVVVLAAAIVVAAASADASTECAPGTYDARGHSFVPTGTCVLWSPPCQPGTTEVTPPSSTSDRVCATAHVSDGDSPGGDAADEEATKVRIVGSRAEIHIGDGADVARIAKDKCGHVTINSGVVIEGDAVLAGYRHFSVETAMSSEPDDKALVYRPITLGREGGLPVRGFIDYTCHINPFGDLNYRPTGVGSGGMYSGASVPFVVQRGTSLHCRVDDPAGRLSWLPDCSALLLDVESAFSCVAFGRVLEPPAARHERDTCCVGDECVECAADHILVVGSSGERTCVACTACADDGSEYEAVPCGGASGDAAQDRVCKPNAAGGSAWIAGVDIDTGPRCCGASSPKEGGGMCYGQGRRQDGTLLGDLHCLLDDASGSTAVVASNAPSPRRDSGLAVTDSGTLVVVGGWLEDGSVDDKVCRLPSGAATWSCTTAPWGGARLKRVVCTGAEELVALGGSSTASCAGDVNSDVWRSSDGGDTWTKLVTTGDELTHLWHMHVASPAPGTVVFCAGIEVCGSSLSVAARCMASTDSGETWATTTTSTPWGHLMSFGFVSNLAGELLVVAGSERDPVSGSWTEQARVWRSTDGLGADWSLVNGTVPWAGRSAEESVAVLPSGQVVLWGGAFSEDSWVSCLPGFGAGPSGCERCPPGTRSADGLECLAIAAERSR